MQNKPFLLSGLIGLAVIVMSLVLMFVTPQPAGDLPEDFFTLIIAFEFAESPDEVYMLFGTADSPARDALVDRVTLSTVLDFLYMALYGSFLFTFAVTCVRLTGNDLFYAAAVLAVVVVLADAAENIQLLRIMGNLAGGSFGEYLSRLKLYTWLKWGGLALGFMLLIPYFSKGNAYSRFIAMNAGFPFVLGMMAFFSRGLLNELFALSVALMFVLMIIYCFVTAVSADAVSNLHDVSRE